MRAILDVSGKFRGQLRFMSEDPYFLMNCGCERMLTEDGHIVNQDRAYEVCSKVALMYDLQVTDAAFARLKELTNASDVSTPSFIPPFDGFEFKGFQKRAINVMGDEANVMLQMSPGTGKAQPSDEPVLTPDGWVPIGSLEVGDIVYDGSGAETAVSGVFPQGELEEYEVTFADGRRSLCGLEHIWRVSKGRTGKGRIWHDWTVEKILSDGVMRPDGKAKFCIPLNGPIERSEADLPVDPYVLGVLIGDGCLTGTSIVVSSNEEDVMCILADRLGPDYSVKKYDSDNYSWGVSYSKEYGVNPLKDALRCFGLLVGSHEKFIPSVYMTASIGQRRMLLAGLFDADGSVGKNGRFTFSTTSKRLRDDFIELCLSLGYQSNFRIDSRPGRRDCYEVWVGTNDVIFQSGKHKARFDESRSRKTGRLRLYDSVKIVDIRKTGRIVPMTCISVASSENTYITRDYVVTHNTLTSIFMACQRLDRNIGDKIVVWCPVALIYDWVKEIRRSTKLTVATPLRSWSADKRRKFYESSDADVWVLNYERVRTVDREAIERVLKTRRPLFIFDEIQKIKGRTSTVHKEIAKMARRVNARAKIALTATPIVSGPEDYYNEFRIIEPGIFGNVRDFEREFTYNNGEKTMFGAYVGYQNLAYMHVMTGAQVFSADKSQPEIAKEFPQKHEILLPYELSREERKVYDAIYDYGRTLDPEERCGTLFMLTFMRLCNMPEVLLKPHAYDGSEYSRQLMRIDEICQSYRRVLEGSSHSAKLELATEKVEEIIGSGEKVIVFAQHTHNCLLPLAQHWKAHEPLVYIGEGMTPDQKEAVKRSFKEDASRKLLLMSDAGQVGLNFQECRYLLHYQTPTSHAAYEQRSDRVHRIDTEYDYVTVMRMMAEETVEERVEDTMQGRRRMATEMGFGDEYEEYGTITQEDADFFCGF